MIQRSLVLYTLLLVVLPTSAAAAGWAGVWPEDPPAKLNGVPWRDWLIQIGPDHNTYPGGSNDPWNYFGAMQGSIDDYPDQWDVVDPLMPEEFWDEHSLGLRFVGDEWGDNPTYPYDPRTGSKGLSWDVRAPYPRGFKIWRAELFNPDPGYTYDLVWHLDPFPGFWLQVPPNFAIRLDKDGSFADQPPGDDPRWYDLSNYEIDLQPGYGGPDYIIEGLPQTGEVEIWHIIAGCETRPIGVPEPSVACLAPLIVGAAAPMLCRSRRRR